MYYRKSGVREAVFAAITIMATISGHSNLLLAPEAAFDNKYTQQSTGDEWCRIWPAISLDFDDGWGATCDLSWVMANESNNN